jgi:hypothetical protein
VSSSREHNALALVDVELFVLAGAPRAAFTVLADAGASASGPAFRVDDVALVEAGWRRDGLDGSLQPSGASRNDPDTPHPFALGSVWIGSGCWRAEFAVGDVVVVGLVDHRWSDSHSEICDLGDELTSKSPWRWHVLTPTGSAVCGRAETPVLAAFAAEDALIASGARIIDRTTLRRAMPR